MAKRKNPRNNNNVKTKIAEAPAEAVTEAPATEIAGEAPAAEAANEAPAEIASEAPAEIASEAPAEAANETPAESGVVKVSIPGCKDRSYQIKPGTTWGEFMKKNGVSLKPGWRAMISGKVIDDSTQLKPGDIVKVANKPKNG